MLGICALKTQDVQYVFLYFTEGEDDDGEDELNRNFSPLGNRVYRYQLLNDKLVHPKLILDLPATPGPRHSGGAIDLGPDGNIYVSIGDLDGTFRDSKYQTIAQNYLNGSNPDGRAGLLRVKPDGNYVDDPILGNSYPLNLYYAYGIRNSFGFDWDPVTGKLWDTENGPHFGDEINLVEKGFNSGWVQVQGLWQPQFEDIGKPFFRTDQLVNFGGNGIYSNPEFIWIPPVAPTAVVFLNSKSLGNIYEDDMFVGDANLGNLYRFELNENRSNLALEGKLNDSIADSVEELDSAIFGTGFGRITDIEVGPDGFLYVLSSEDKGAAIYKIVRRSG